MRAFAIDEFGQPGSVREVPTPEPGEGQVRVKVAAASVNPFDNAVLKGMLKDRMPHHFPLIPASDVSGTVDKLGSGVEKLEVGDQVFGQLGIMGIGHGSMAEYALASTGTLARRPDFIDPEFGAALPLAGVSALQCIEPMGLARGDAVVIMGAAGAIGGFAVQLAKRAGATVVGIASSHNADYVRKAHPNGVKAVVHASGDGDTAMALAGLVNEGGYVASMRGAAKVDELQARRITGINVGTRVTTEALEKLAAMVKAGELERPAIKTFSLEDASAAFAESATGHARGKLVVLP